ncbi:MAG: hypothetical protein ACE5FO_06760, partial [Parvularculaceae bacterium]
SRSHAQKAKHPPISANAAPLPASKTEVVEASALPLSYTREGGEFFRPHSSKGQDGTERGKCAARTRVKAGPAA